MAIIVGLRDLTGGNSLQTSEALKVSGRVKRIAGVLGVSSRLASGEDHVGIVSWTIRCTNSPRLERMACPRELVLDVPDAIPLR
jgi:hypothetical protein